MVETNSEGIREHLFLRLTSPGVFRLVFVSARKRKSQKFTAAVCRRARAFGLSNGPCLSYGRTRHASTRIFSQSRRWRFLPHCHWMGKDSRRSSEDHPVMERRVQLIRRQYPHIPPPPAPPTSRPSFFFPLREKAVRPWPDGWQWVLWPWYAHVTYTFFSFSNFWKINLDEIKVLST